MSSKFFIKVVWISKIVHSYIFYSSLFLAGLDHSRNPLRSLTISPPSSSWRSYRWSKRIDGLPTPLYVASSFWTTAYSHIVVIIIYLFSTTTHRSFADTITILRNLTKSIYLIFRFRIRTHTLVIWCIYTSPDRQGITCAGYDSFWRNSFLHFHHIRSPRSARTNKIIMRASNSLCLRRGIKGLGNLRWKIRRSRVKLLLCVEELILFLILLGNILASVVRRPRCWKHIAVGTLLAINSRGINAHFGRWIKQRRSDLRNIIYKTHQLNFVTGQHLYFFK